MSQVSLFNPIKVDMKRLILKGNGTKHAFTQAHKRVFITAEDIASTYTHFLLSVNQALGNQT